MGRFVGTVGTKGYAVSIKMFVNNLLENGVLNDLIVQIISIPENEIMYTGRVSEIPNRILFERYTVASISRNTDVNSPITHTLRVYKELP